MPDTNNRKEQLDSMTTTATRTEEVLQQLWQLSEHIRLAKQQEEHLLSRLVSRHDVWAALRNEKDPHFVENGQERAMRRQVQQQRQQQTELSTTQAAPQPAPSQTKGDERTTSSTISFGEFSNMETDIKRACIRQGLLRQRDKIKSLLQRMKQRRAALSSAAASSKNTGSK